MLDYIWSLNHLAGAVNPTLVTAKTSNGINAEWLCGCEVHVLVGWHWLLSNKPMYLNTDIVSRIFQIDCHQGWSALTGFWNISDKAIKGQFTPKSETHIFHLTCGAIYQSRSEVFNRGSATPRGSAEVLQGGREIFGWLDFFFFIFPHTMFSSNLNVFKYTLTSIQHTVANR